MTMINTYSASFVTVGLLMRGCTQSKHFKSFAKGLKEDYDAVKAGMTLDVSNGPVEGQNNRLKMLKRQMFGRANLELLEKRFILTS